MSKKVDWRQVMNHPDWPEFQAKWRTILSKRFHDKGLDPGDHTAWPKLVAKWTLNEADHAWRTRND